MTAELFSQLITDPAHWAFEVVSDIVLGALLYYPSRRAWDRWHRHHDSEHHA